MFGGVIVLEYLCPLQMQVLIDLQLTILNMERISLSLVDLNIKVDKCNF
jgi:hypothetical protein